MTDELVFNLCLIVKQKSGGLETALYSEFKKLCQKEFNFSPDMSCGRCIYKHAVKLHDKLIVGSESK
jgi:hypothetical protein